jgi:hypothetical protein
MSPASAATAATSAPHHSLSTRTGSDVRIRTYNRASSVLPEVAAPLSGTAGEFFYAVRNDFRQLHHLLTQFGVFRNVALNAVAIGPQFSPERLKLT